MKEDKLILNPKKIGREIINLAIGKHKDLQSDKVVTQVGVLMERINVLTLLQTKTSKQMKLCQDQFDAIEAGEFEINQHTAQIIYNKKELNISWDETGRW